MKQRKVIFLDIDGVLINRESFMAPLKMRGVRVAAHPACMAQLNRIIADTGAGIVVSSTWRLMRKSPRDRTLPAQSRCWRSHV